MAFISSYAPLNFLGFNKTTTKTNPLPTVVAKPALADTFQRSEPLASEPALQRSGTGFNFHEAQQALQQEALTNWIRFNNTEVLHALSRHQLSIKELSNQWLGETIFNNVLSTTANPSAYSNLETVIQQYILECRTQRFKNRNALKTVNSEILDPQPLTANARHDFLEVLSNYLWDTDKTNTRQLNVCIQFAAHEVIPLIQPLVKLLKKLILTSCMIFMPI